MAGLDVVNGRFVAIVHHSHETAFVDRIGRDQLGQSAFTRLDLVPGTVEECVAESVDAGLE